MTIAKRTELRRHWILGIFGAAIALGLTGLGLAKLSMTNPTKPNQMATNLAPAALPKRGEVVALGRLEPQGEVIRVGGPNGERIQHLTVKEGDFVPKGAVLAYLESHQERLAERNYAASQLAEAKARLKATTDYGKAQIQEAKTRVQQIDRPGTFEINAQKAAVRKLEAELDLANADLQRNQSLYSQGAIAKQTLDRQSTQVRQLQEQINSAKATLIQLDTGWKMNSQNAQAQLRSQQANLPLTQVQVAVASATQNLTLASARLERTLIRSTKSGRILRIIAHEGEAIGDSGILDLGDTRQMNVVAEVYETDLRLVKVGQPVTIASRNGAFSKPLTGKVIEVGWQIFKNNVLDDDPAANADARVVEVKIRLDDSKPVAGMTNLQVDVRIRV
ncbi:MAG: HlyD family efflux transporter periplasmic adaptor subunit [Kovacikia sp.]